MRTLFFTNRILFSFFLILSFLASTGKLAFGHGLGDLSYFIFLWLMTIAYGIWLIFLQRMKDSYMSIGGIIIFSLVFIILVYSMTVGRGPEYRWNGDVFYSN